MREHVAVAATEPGRRRGPLAIPAAERHHLRELQGELGIMQHANGSRPDPRHGYCTDDVARSLVVDLLHARELGWRDVAESAAISVAFLEEAFNHRSGRFRNMRAADGTWLDEEGSEDAHARAVYALASASVSVPDPRLRAAASGLVASALPACLGLANPRPQAAAFLAADTLAGNGRDPGHAACLPLADALWASVGPTAWRRAGITGGVGTATLSAAWPWPEATLTYENGIVPQALIAAGRRLARSVMLVHGLRLLDWLLLVETAPEGHLSTIGNEGWYPSRGRKATWDQQPIEATSLLLAAEAAADATGSARYRDAVERCYGWFLGRNDLGVAVAIPERGSCHDGLTPRGPNPNQGAESTLAWLTAVEHVRAARRIAGGRRPPQARTVAVGARA